MCLLIKDRFCTLGVVRYLMVNLCRHKVKGKAAPLQAWSGPEGSRKLRLPDYVTTAQDDGKVVSLTHRLPLPSRTHFY